MRRSLSLLAVLCATLRCASSPVPPRPAAEGVASAPSPRPRIVAHVGDASVVAYPPRGFDRLAPAERVLAYHLALASIAGDPVYILQTSRFAWPVTQVVMRLLAHREALGPPLREALSDYRRRLFVNRGLHDAWTGKKFLPGFSRADFEAAARAAGVEVGGDLLAAMFDPRVAPVLVNRTPGPDRDPVVESAANYYEGVTSRELESFHERYELNGRVVKEDGRLVEQVFRAGGDGAPPGLAAEPLARVVKHLEDAIAIAPPPEAEALRHLVRYLRSGDPGEFRAHDVAWVAQSFPVDYILGFVGTYNDVRGRKGTFVGLVTVPDPERDPPLQALARSALDFERRLPWDDRYKRDAFPRPAAAAVQLLAAGGFGGPRAPGGVALPDAQDFRERYGTKSFFVLTGADIGDAFGGLAVLDELAPPPIRAAVHRCARAHDAAFTALHEVIGHGSGKVSPGLSADPQTLLAPYFGTLEEARANLVAYYLMGDPRTVEIGLLPDECARLTPELVAIDELAHHAEVPEGDAVEEDHLRASMIHFGVLREKGALSLVQKDGRTFAAVPDPAAFRRVTAELLSELQRIKATGDKAAIQALVERHGTRLDTRLRDEIVARFKAIDVPQADSFLPPLLTPVRDAAGAVVDVRAEQAPSLDAVIAWYEQTWGG